MENSHKHTTNKTKILAVTLALFAINLSQSPASMVDVQSEKIADSGDSSFAMATFEFGAITIGSIAVFLLLNRKRH